MPKFQITPEHHIYSTWVQNGEQQIKAISVFILEIKVLYDSPGKEVWILEISNYQIMMKIIDMGNYYTFMPAMNPW